jgi:hypothetical protein
MHQDGRRTDKGSLHESEPHKNAQADKKTKAPGFRFPAPIHERIRNRMQRADADSAKAGCNPDTAANACAHANTNRNANIANPYAASNADAGPADAYTASDANPYSCPYPHAYSDARTNANANSNSDCFAKPRSNPNPNPYTHARNRLHANPGILGDTRHRRLPAGQQPKLVAGPIARPRQ